MEAKNMLVGKKYRRPSWTEGLYVTVELGGVMVKSWTKHRSIYTAHRTWKDFYECDGHGVAIKDKSISFEEWVDGMRNGHKGKQSANPNGYFVYTFNPKGKDGFDWFARGSKEPNEHYTDYDLSESFDGLGHILWLEEKVLARTSEETNKINKEDKMKDCKVEIKVDGKIVDIKADTKAKKAKVIKYIGKIYTAEDELQDELGFYSKKEALAEMQKPKNLGCTIELFKKCCTLSTKIPVVEIKA